MERGFMLLGITAVVLISATAMRWTGIGFTTAQFGTNQVNKQLTSPVATELDTQSATNTHRHSFDEQSVLVEPPNPAPLNNQAQPSKHLATVLIDATDNPTSLYRSLITAGISIPGIDDNSDIDTVLSALFLNTSHMHDEALDIIFTDWLKWNPAAAWWWIEANDSTGVLNRYRHAIVQNWLMSDSDAALHAISNLSPSSVKTQLLADYASHIVSDEPERAFYWAYSLHNDSERRQVLDRVVYQWASTNPEQVITHLNGIENPTIRKQLVLQSGPSITAKLSQTDPLRSMLWTASLDTTEREFLSPIAFHQWVNKNPEEAFNWLNGNNDTAHRNLYMETVAGTLAYQNLPVAMDVFTTQSEPVQEKMASSIAFGLYQQNPIEAEIWTNNLSSQAAQQNANRGMLFATVDEAPETALQMAVEYQGEDQDNVLATTAMEVDQQHPNLLESWLETAPLSGYQQFIILEALVRTPTD